MTDKEKAAIILTGIEKYLQFDLLQKEYATKGILEALQKIRRNEND